MGGADESNNGSGGRRGGGGGGGERVSFSAQDLINGHNREERVANYQTISSNISSIGDADPTTDERNLLGFQESTQTVLISNVVEALGEDNKANDDENGGHDVPSNNARAGRPATSARLNPRALRGLAKTSSLPARILTQALDQDMDEDLNGGLGLDGNFYSMFAVNEEDGPQQPTAAASASAAPEFDELDVLTQSSRRAAQARPAHPAECVLPPSEEEHSKAFLFWVKVATNFDGMTLPPKLLMIAYLGWYIAVMLLLPNKSWDPIVNASVIGVLVGLVLNANAFAAYKAAFYSCKRAGGRSNLTPNVPTYLKNQTWSVFRLFFIPFAVSSYSGAAGGAAPGTFVSVFPSSINVWGPALLSAIFLPSLLVVGREWAWKKAEKEEQKEFFLRVRNAPPTAADAQLL